MVKRRLHGRRLKRGDQFQNKPRSKREKKEREKKDIQKLDISLILSRADSKN